MSDKQPKKELKPIEELWIEAREAVLESFRRARADNAKLARQDNCRQEEEEDEE